LKSTPVKDLQPWKISLNSNLLKKSNCHKSGCPISHSGYITVDFKEKRVGFSDCLSAFTCGSGSPRTNVLGHSQSSLRDWSSLSQNPGLRPGLLSAVPSGLVPIHPIADITYYRQRPRSTFHCFKREIPVLISSSLFTASGSSRSMLSAPL
jgi:hypothetical protein